MLQFFLLWLGFSTGDLLVEIMKSGVPVDANTDWLTYLYWKVDWERYFRRTWNEAFILLAAWYMFF